MPARPWEEARAWFGVEQVISQFYQFLSEKNVHMGQAQVILACRAQSARDTPG